MGGGLPLREGQLIRGPLFTEPMRVETVLGHGNGTWVLGLVGTKSGRFGRVSLGQREAAGPRFPLPPGSVERVPEPDGDRTHAKGKLISCRGGLLQVSDYRTDDFPVRAIQHDRRAGG